ncbi:MAG: PIG-L family deacetylase [Clostridia bacterium]|nr:PIG-L family deacetylase [Clostridia bacterium]
MKKLKVLMIGAHPDDNDICGGGLALKYASAGHSVRFLSVCNGCGGHHVQKPADIAARRYKETQEVAKLAGIEYDVWDIPDCEVIADLETRKKLICYIREYNPDIIFTHKTNDYHADHRNTALLVQDASYLLIVPNLCPEAAPMIEMPVIMYFRNRFKNPPFVPDMIVDIDDVIDKKYLLWNCHTSQFYEWLPYTDGIIDRVPENAEERIEWLHSPRVSRDTPCALDELLAMKTECEHSEAREAVYAARYRDLLVSRYGERGKKVIFAEAYETSEYGTPLTEENAKVLFPF